MTVFDYAVLLIVGLSVAVGAVRGLIREAFSLAGWVLAFLVANTYGGEVAGMLRSAIHSDSARVIAAFVLVFVTVLLAMGITGMLLSRLFRLAGLGLADRALGAIFGLARGIVVILVAVLLAGLSSMPREPMWRGALLAPPLETAVIAAKPWLPRDVAERIRYR